MNRIVRMRENPQRARRRGRAMSGPTAPDHVAQLQNAERPVNLWTEAEHAEAYLAHREADPTTRARATRRWWSSLPAQVGRVLDLGCGDGEVCAPGARACARTRRRSRSTSRPRCSAGSGSASAATRGSTIVEHDLDTALPDGWGTFDLVVSALRDPPRARPAQAARSTARSTTGCGPGGAFLNLEHVDSPTPELHAAFLDAIGVEPRTTTTRRTSSAPVEAQLRLAA